MPYKDPAKQREYQNQWVQARRAMWFQENGPCMDCGSWDDLEVDHEDRATKVSHKVFSWSKARREVELAKCVVRCKSCHLTKSKESGDLGSGHRRIPLQDIEEIRACFASGESTKSLSERFGCRQRHIRDIVSMQTRVYA